MIGKTAANEAMLEIAVDAVGAGHDLGGFVAVDGAVGLPEGYEA